MLTHEVITKYHSRRREDLEICRKSMASRDYNAIERVGHKLKGNGLTFGYPELSKLGEDLETSAQTLDLTKLQNLIRFFEDWVARLDRDELTN